MYGKIKGKFLANDFQRVMQTFETQEVELHN